MKFFDNKTNQNSNSFMILQSSSEMYCRNEEIYSKSVTGFCSCNMNALKKNWETSFKNDFGKISTEKNPTKSKERFFYIKYFS